MSIDVPAGFEELPEGLGFTDILAPVYRRAGDTPAIGMFVQARHANLLNICHGGVLMTLAAGRGRPGHEGFAANLEGMARLHGQG